MTESPDRPERTILAPGLEISRIVTGLWQVADQEREGPLDPGPAAEALIAYADAGFDSFDMADHYGSAELIAGEARRRLIARDGETRAKFFTKWCPRPHEAAPADVRAGIAARLDRLGVERVDLLQLHWWTYEHPGYIDVMDGLMALKAEGRIGHVGLTNFDAEHLRLLVSEGYEIASNQVVCSLLDRRALGELSRVCREHGVRLLTYGALAGGFLSDRWLGAEDPAEIADWSRMKYRRFIEVAGGWERFQALLRALDAVARRHGVSIANVATRWMLEAPAVAAVIVGARLGEREHRAENLVPFRFALTAEDRAEIDAALAGLAPIPGDCGGEYRKPPFLTASGDLSHHLDALPPVHEAVARDDGRTTVGSASAWEAAAGFSRAVRIGERILVSGTTATHGDGRMICPGDARGQTVYALDKIAAAIRALGGAPEDVVRTRIYMRDCAKWEGAAAAHRACFGEVMPANTLLEVARIVGDYEVEIEAEAVARVGAREGASEGSPT